MKAKRSFVLVALGIVLGVSAPAYAYIGPGAGITMLGALWAVILAVVLAIGGILFWPLRAMLRRRRRAGHSADRVSTENTAGDD